MLQRRKILQYHTNKYNIHMYNFRLVLYVWVLSIIGILVINSAADGFAAKPVSYTHLDVYKRQGIESRCSQHCTGT